MVDATAREMVKASIESSVSLTRGRGGGGDNDRGSRGRGSDGSRGRGNDRGSRGRGNDRGSDERASRRVQVQIRNVGRGRGRGAEDVDGELKSVTGSPRRSCYAKCQKYYGRC